MSEYIKLIAKPNTYYDAGTEVFNYEGNLFTLEEWLKWEKVGMVLVRGYKNGELDGEYSSVDEFYVIHEK